MSLKRVRIDHWTRWHLVAAVVMALLAIWTTRAAWADIYHIASIDEESSHIFLVPIVAAWMVWVRRARFRHCSPSGILIGPLVLLVGWALSYYGFYHQVQSLWHGGTVLIVLGAIFSVLGKNVIFRFFPAFAVLVFLVPVPGKIRLEIALPLQVWLAQISQYLLTLLGFDIGRSGNLLTINGSPVNIAEACNGLRMVFALILVTYAFAFGMPLRNSVRVLLLLASPLAAIGLNVLRILPTALLYGYKSKNTADMFHDYSGWMMLPLAFLILLGLMKVLKWAMIPITRYPLAE